MRRPSRRRPQSGQVLPLMAVGMVAMLGLTGMVTDIGNYFHQNRIEQNAAEAAAHAATTYWAGKMSSATDRDLYCLTQLYSSSSAYQSLTPSTCPAAAGVSDNLGKGTVAYYVNGSGNHLGTLGQQPARVASAAYPSATGIEVDTSTDSGAFFSRIFSVTGFNVSDRATFHLGSVGAVPSQICISVPVPGRNQPQSCISVFPATFELSTYLSATLYSPFATTTASADQQFMLQSSCNSTGSFCWSGLQCTISRGNDLVKYWLTGTDPCPGIPTALGTSQYCLQNPTDVSCTVSSDPGVRDIDFFDAQANWTGKVAIVPIINGGTGTNAIIQFAYFYIDGTGGVGSNSYISGFFLDPSQMPPLPSGIYGTCVPGSGVPCGVTGG